MSEATRAGAATGGQHHYRSAGVDTAKASRGLDRLLTSLRGTFAQRAAGPGRVLLDFGQYAGLIDLGGGRALAIATDGVGSKILVAELLGRYDTLGIDLIAMNANDLVCIGAEPLAMVDYIATESLDEDVLAEIGVGLARGAEAARITIPAGEIAQLPEMIRGARPRSGIDLVGTCVGTVDTERVITGARLAGGEVLIGLASSGLHSNGYTLARKVLLEDAGLDLARPAPGLDRPLGDALLEPTVIYVRCALELIDELDVRAMAHITGDGMSNLKRLSPGLSHELTSLPPLPPIIGLVGELGGIAASEMVEVFNMGIGLVIAVPAEDADDALRIAERHGHPAMRLGRTVDDGKGEVRLPELGVTLGDGAGAAPDVGDAPDVGAGAPHRSAVE